MLTRSSIFAEFAERHGIQVDTIVRVTIGADEYLFSHRPMPKGLNTAPIYPILEGCDDIEEGLDIYSKALNHSSITITLSDIPFYPSTGSTPQRASELLTGINGTTVDVYFMAGDEIADIDDCLHVFSGYVFAAPRLARGTFTFEAENKIKTTDVIIPPRVIEDEVSTTPTEFKNIPIPLVYGIFHLGEQKDWMSEYVLDYPGTGLVKGYPISNARHAYYIIADHDIYVQDAFFNLSGPTVVFIEYPRFQYTGPNSLLLVGPEALELICSLMFPLESNLPGIYDDESYQADNPEKAETYDGQYATMRDNQFDNTSTMAGRGLWAFKHPDLFAKHVSSANLIKAYYTNLVAKSGVTITQIAAYLYFGREDGADDDIQIGQKVGGISYPGGQCEITNTGVSIDDLASELFEEYVFALEVTSSAQGQGDGTLDNQEMLDVDYLHVKLYWTLEDRPNEIWTTCKGIRFGPWITSAGRSNPGGFTTARYIEHVVYIIESLYRIYLGLSDADIDTESFDNAYEEVLEGRINIFDQQPLSDYVRQLCEQSTFAVCHSSTGKVRAVKLNDASPSIAATIERHQLIDDQMTVVKSSRIINSMTVHSNWHAQYGKFFDLATYEDADSITAHRTRSAEYKWENITDDAAEHVANAYVSDVDGLWSKEHIEATFSTFGLIHSHLEVGDWISLSTDLDDLRAPFDGTWYGKSLLISKIKKSDTSIEITAVEIIAYEYSPSPSPSPGPSPIPELDGLWLIDDDTDPANSTLGTGYSALLDGIYNVLACKPWTEGPSVGIDMGEIITLESLRLYDTGIFGAGLKTGAQLKLYISDNNDTWSYIETYTSMSRIATGGTYDPYYIDCVFTTAQTARYFKLYSPGEPLKVPAGYSLILSELEPTVLSPSPSPSP